MKYTIRVEFPPALPGHLAEKAEIEALAAACLTAIRAVYATAGKITVNAADVPAIRAIVDSPAGWGADARAAQHVMAICGRVIDRWERWPVPADGNAQ